MTLENGDRKYLPNGWPRRADWVKHRAGSAWFTRGNGPEPVRVLVVQSPNRTETMRDVQKAELAQNPPYVGGTK